jgi:hypothetical protein
MLQEHLSGSVKQSVKQNCGEHGPATSSPVVCRTEKDTNNCYDSWPVMYQQRAQRLGRNTSRFERAEASMADAKQTHSTRCDSTGAYAVSCEALASLLIKKTAIH